jgi:putative hydrolase of the HAD superfamily
MSDCPMPPTRAIIFDLDDTLYLERDYALSGYRAVAAAFRTELGGDMDRAVAAMQESLERGDRRRVFDEALDRLGRPRDPLLVRRMIETYRGHSPRIQLCDDARRALARLSPVARLGLISDGPCHQQSLKIAALDLARLIESIILTDDYGPGFAKPHPRAFEEMAARLGLSHDRCTYVADNPTKDFIAPNALGWTSIRIRRPLGIYSDAPVAAGGAPQRTLTTLDELS